MCEKLQYGTFPCTKIVGDEECAVVNVLNANGCLGREKELVEAHNLKPFPDNICRIKLSVLSYELRNILRGLPIAVFSGPSKSGKTALREFMISASTGNVDSIFLKSGFQNEQRTVIPQLVHIRDKQKPFFVLDTVGNDTDATLKGIFGKINEILAVAVNVEVLICNSHEKEAHDHFRKRTSSLLFRDGNVEANSRAVSFSKPTLTCFTKPDTYTQVFTLENGVDKLRTQCNMEIGQNRLHYDLRSITENVQIPRYWVCIPDFSAYTCLKTIYGVPIKLPEEYRDSVMMPEDVQKCD